MQVRLWNLVSHGDCIRDELHDGAGDWRRRETGESFAKKSGRERFKSGASGPDAPQLRAFTVLT